MVKWILRKRTKSRIQAAEISFLRWVAGLTLRDGVEMFRHTLGKTLGLLGYTIQYGCIAHCAFEYIGEFVVCSGPSMEPTIVSHDVVFSERMSRHLFKIEKGDIVIAKSPFDPQMNICKRVIGLEGDKICTSSPSDLFKTHTYVPMGHVWLEGDNLRNSTDSRNYGPIPYALIRGRVCWKLWPLHSFGTLSESPMKRIIKAQRDSNSD
ncbi:mitochondrial inner membrane protease subunit 1 isoform X1 [Gambusia affinis]|nr:mitochondrial inner membrane protease subunit 1 isoform X1 [Gambusia affinis]